MLTVIYEAIGFIAFFGVLYLALVVGGTLA